MTGIPEHRFNSDGFCKECGERKSNVVDKFCDGDNNIGIDAFINETNPGHKANVSSYLAGIKYMASIWNRS